MVETALNLFGLVLTGVGAFVTAQAVIISDEDAKSLSRTAWDGNEALYGAFLAQSRNAWRGLICVVFGTALQAIALIYPLAAPYLWAR
jgi:hypothetical protein